MNKPFSRVFWLSIPIFLVSCGGGSGSESKNDAASPSGPGADAAIKADVTTKNDSTVTSAEVHPGPLSGALLDLVGTWTCSGSSSSSTYVLTTTTMHQEMKLASVGRVLDGDIAGFSTDRQEYDTGRYTDGFLVVRITKNEGLQIASVGEYGRLSWQDVATNRKKLLLDSGYFATAEKAAAKLPTSYSIWDTCTRSDPKDAASPSDAASPPDGTSTKDAADPLDATRSPDAASPFDTTTSPDASTPLDAGMSLDTLPAG